MLLDEALSMVAKGHRFDLEDNSVFQVIQQEDFYLPSPVKMEQENTSCRFILFSAPGAVGKTALAKHIAKNYQGFYWNVAQKPINGTSFLGELAHAVGVGNGAKQDKFISELCAGHILVILDAFDEAALISGRDGVKDFLIEIGEVLQFANNPSIILMARTEMAKFIMEICDEKNIPTMHYSIEYFDPEKAFDFISEYLNYNNISLSFSQQNAVKSYINAIKMRLSKSDVPHGAVHDKVRTFLGYAQVLRILARRIEQAAKNNSKNMALDLTIEFQSGNNLIYDIIQQLISREQEKLDAFKNEIREKYVYQDKEHIVDNLYSKEEQLLRLGLFLYAGGVESIKIDDVPACNELFPEDRSRYIELLREWLPQHVFLRGDNILPVFDDYLFAESLLNPNLYLFADVYTGSGNATIKLPTRVFMDCYLALNNATVNGNHIYFIDSAYTSQGTNENKIFCEIGYKDVEAPDDLYLTYSEGTSAETALSIKIIRDIGSPIILNRIENMSVNVPGRIVLDVGITSDVVIHQALIECDVLEIKASEVKFEAYGDEENILIIHEKALRKSGSKIIFKGVKNIKADIPEQELHELHELYPYKYSFTDDNIDANTSIEKFSYGLKKVLEQFKIDRYDNGLTKHKEKIDARCKTGIKKEVLDFLLEMKLIYDEGIFYKCDSRKMNEFHINRNAYVHSNDKRHNEILQPAYERFVQWERNR